LACIRLVFIRRPGVTFVANPIAIADVVADVHISVNGTTAINVDVIVPTPTTAPTDIAATPVAVQVVGEDQARGDADAEADDTAPKRIVVMLVHIHDAGAVGRDIDDLRIGWLDLNDCRR
jgi:hypothetical protein